jgi:hypothetical protein
MDTLCLFIEIKKKGLFFQRQPMQRNVSCGSISRFSYEVPFGRIMLVFEVPLFNFGNKTTFLPPKLSLRHFLLRIVSYGI